MPAHDWLTHAVPLDDFDVDALLEREWLCTNGTGAYAMGTAAGCNTRRYHGLFIACTHPPVGRIVALHQVVDSLILHHPEGGGSSSKAVDQRVLDFANLQFMDDRTGKRMLEPHGWSMLRRFERRVSVAWAFGFGRLQVRRELRLHWKEQAMTMRWRITGLHKHCERATLKLSPMLSFRDFHALMTRDAVGERPIQAFPHADKPGVVTFKGQGQAVTFGVACDCGCDGQEKVRFLREPDWWYGVRYPCDAERGQGDCEDHYIPGRFEVALDATPKIDITMTVKLGEEPGVPVVDSGARATHLNPMLPKFEMTAGQSQPGQSQSGQSEIVPADYGLPEPDADNPDLPPVASDRVIRSLLVAADDFVVDRTPGGAGELDGQTTQGTTILAGYPWFADWGRDTFIALPGLLLCTGRYDEAKQVLATFASAIRNGLVPNRFDDYDNAAAHYNTVDGSLWYLNAALSYMQHTRDSESWNGWLRDACVKIADAFEKGTDYGIRVDDDGLVTAGSPNTQLTWMDAAAVDPNTGQLVIFTPRYGKAVEINALWHHGLLELADQLQADDAKRADHYRELAGRCQASFMDTFWYPAGGYLFDHVITDANGKATPDLAIRPNQVIAASLPRSPLSQKHRMAVVKTARQHLLTPYGLRTLPKGDPNDHPRYTGPQFERDQAYHQGTIWPWLIGPYAEAVLRADDFSLSSRKMAWDTIRPLVDFMLGDGLGQLFEIHEASAPFRPVGCKAQAWSVSEVVRILHLIHAGKSMHAPAASGL